MKPVSHSKPPQHGRTLFRHYSSLSSLIDTQRKDCIRSSHHPYDFTEHQDATANQPKVWLPQQHEQKEQKYAWVWVDVQAHAQTTEFLHRVKMRNHSPTHTCSRRKHTMSNCRSNCHACVLDMCSMWSFCKRVNVCRGTLQPLMWRGNQIER